MEKVKIKIVRIGNLKYNVNFKKIINWKTDFFDICHEIDERELINSQDKEEDGEIYYSDQSLRKIIGITDSSILTVGLINQRIQNNFYERFLGNNVIILSLYETAEIVLKEDFKIHHFIIQELYYMASVFYINRGLVPETEDEFIHHDIRGCIFDFNDNKSDIIHSLGKVTICKQDEELINMNFDTKDLVKIFRKELKRIKKGNYYRFSDFIKKRLLLSIFLGLISALILGVLTNFIYDILKNYYLNCYK